MSTTGEGFFCDGTEVLGILIFLHERDDPGQPSDLATPDGPFTAVYLNRFLPEIACWRVPALCFVPVPAAEREGLASRSPKSVEGDNNRIERRGTDLIAIGEATSLAPDPITQRVGLQGPFARIHQPPQPDAPQAQG